MPSDPVASRTYRLIITRGGTEEILVSQSGADWVLPRMEIREDLRVAEQLTKETWNRWGIETYCLLAQCVFLSDHENEARYALLECVKNKKKVPTGMFWVSAHIASNGRDGEEAAVIREAFRELARCADGTNAGAFAKPGWLRELFQWTSEQTAPLGLRLTGEFTQFNASPTFSLIRLETANGAVWFKATGEPNTHELPVTLLLARLFPSHVPRIIGVHRSWNGWLSAEVKGTPLDELSGCSAWERAAEALAELQIESIGSGTELLEGKCKDLRLPEVEKQVDLFVARMDEFMRVQKKDSPAPLSCSELVSLREGLKDGLSLLKSFGLPDTLGHLDSNPGNFVVSPERCVFLDWAEASLTNPLITFEYLRRHLERSGVKESSADARIVAAYVRPWTALFTAEDLLRALAMVPPIAVLVHAIASDRWRTLEPASNPTLAGYYRALTRRMYRDTIVAAERSERCVS